MRVELSDRFCATVKAAAAQIDYMDSKLPGLTLRVSKHGVKAWGLIFTADGKTSRLTIGRYPEISLAKARTLALEHKATIADGGTPKPKPTDNSLASIWEEYLKRKGELRSIEDRKKFVERVIIPDLGKRPIGEIKRSEIVRLLDKIEDERGARTAHLALMYLSALMNWHAARDDDFRSPIVRGMGRVNAKERERDRVLTDAEIKAIWKAGGDLVFSRYVRFLLLTAVRKNEAAKAEWSEIAEGDWIIPKTRMKGKLEHVVPLSELALAQLRPNNLPWLWTFTGDGPFCNTHRHLQALYEASGTKDWTLHDLRRTARSLLSRAGVAPDIAERVLAHKIGGVRGVYDRYEYLKEKREALNSLAELVGEIVHV